MWKDRVVGSLAHVPSLDGYRAIAVIIVLITHFDFIEFGWISVQMFLVLSGYLISNGLFILKYKESSLKTMLKKFYYRRALRIFPLYYFYLFILMIFYLFVTNKNPYFQHVGQFFPYLYSYTYNLTKFWQVWSFSPLCNHLWTLCVEEQFYFIWPFLILLLPVDVIKKLCVALLFLIPIFRYFLAKYILTYFPYEGLVADTVNWFTFTHFDAFALGTCIHFVDFEKVKNHVFKIGVLLCFAFYIWVGIIHSFILFDKLDFRTLGYPLFSLANNQHVWAYSIGNVFSASLIMYLISCHTQKITNVCTQIFAWKPFVYIGNLSYGMYVFHWFLLTCLRTFFNLGDGIFSFLLWYAVLVGVSSAVYYGFELKFLKLKNAI